MNFPILLKRTNSVDPSSKIYYEIASNGIFQVRTTSFYRSITRTNGPVPGLLSEKERLEVRFPRLPTVLLEEVLAFFLEVFKAHGGEAIATLFFDPDSRSFRVGVPPQTVPGYIDRDGRWKAYYQLIYGSAPRPRGFLRFGSIHSHPTLSAYSSTVDCADERFEDGLHVVLGDLDRSYPSRSVEFSANGVRFRLNPDEVLEPFPVPERPARPEWMARVTREERALPTLVYCGSADGNVYGSTYQGTDSRSHDRCNAEEQNGSEKGKRL